MALEVTFPDDIRRALVAGLVLAIQADQWRNVEFLRGVLAMAAHQARTFGVSWPTVLKQVKDELGDDDLDAVGRALPVAGER